MFAMGERQTLCAMSALATAPRWRQFCVGAFLCAVPAFAAAQGAWQPQKAVEIVVGTSPGGGQDSSARFVQKIIQDRQLTSVPTAVVNKPGGGSSVGYAYLNQHPGDAHYIMLLTVPLLTNHILGLSPIAPSDLSAIAVLFEEYIVATVVPDSPIKSGRDLLERLKKDPSTVNVGVPSLTGGGNFAILMAAKAAGVEPKRVKTVVFKSGGDSMTALLGGHIDVMMSTTAAPLAQRKQGKVRIVAVAAPKRLPGLLADVPTWSEQGARVVFSNWRGIVGPQGLKRPQVQYWEGVFEKLVKEPQFQEDLARNMWVENFKRSDEMRKFLKEDYDELKGLLTELGMAK